MRFKRHLLPAASLAALALAFIAGPDVLAAYGLDTAADVAGLKTDADIPALVGKLLKTALQFVGTLFLLLMVYAGFLWMTARGDEKKVGTAKQLISGAIIGIIIISSAYAITSFVLTAATGEGGTEAPAAPTAESVPVGGDCTDSSQCTPASTTVCDGGKCVSTIE